MTRGEGKTVRNHFVKMRMNNQELEILKGLFKQSTERALSSYLRKTVLQQPIIIRHRNQSADELLKEMIGIKRELNAIGNNFNQAVKKLHTLDKIPEFRTWIRHHENMHNELVQKVEQIRNRMNQVYEKWSQ